MSVMEILKQRFALSFEVSPPKTDVGMEKLCASGGTLERLYTLQPDAVSCTYGFGGSNLGKSLEVLDKVVRDGKTLGITHFTCTGNTRESAAGQLTSFLNRGIDHVLLQQGDLPEGRKRAGGEQLDAAEVACSIRQLFGSRFTIGVNGFSEGRCSIAEDVESLRRKGDSGADYIVTRLCWDMEKFYRWLDAVLAADIRMPIVAGVMPVADQAATIQAALTANGGVIPDGLARLVSQNWIYPNPFVKDPFDPEADRKKAAFRSAGMEYTVSQILAYRACGISGIHLLTNNGFDDAAHIVKHAGLRA